MNDGLHRATGAGRGPAGEGATISDHAIERALARRAPHGPDGALLPRIVAAAAATPQARSLPWRSLGLDRRRILWLGIAFAAITALLGALLVGGAARRDQLSQVPSPAPRASAQPSVPPASADRVAVCTTDRISVMQGEDELPTLAAAPAEVGRLTRDEGRHGAFLTQSDGTWSIADGSTMTGTRYDLWQFGPSSPTARRVAGIGGPGVNTGWIADIAPDGSSQLLIVGKVSPSGANPECLDLYSFPDGTVSGPERLTRSGPGTLVTGASLAQGAIAFVESTFDPVQDGWTRSLRISQPRRAIAGQEIPCGSLDYLALVEWSPRATWIAVDCPDGVAIIDPSGARAARHVRLPGTTAALRWASDDELIVASITSDGLAESRVNVASATVAETTRLGESAAIDWVVGAGMTSLSPDGRWIFASGFPPTSTGRAGDPVGYLVAAAGGSPRQVLGTNELGSVTWDADGSLLYFDHADPSKVVLERLDPRTDTREAVATFDPSIAGGVALAH